MKVSKINGYGNHLMLEGYGGDFNRLNNFNFIKEMLMNLPEYINMKRISDALVVEYKAEDENERGISGVILLAESHISIHTYPRKEFAAIDVFSCKEFNIGKVVRLFKKKFCFSKINQRLVIREYEKN